MRTLSSITAAAALALTACAVDRTADFPSAPSAPSTVAAPAPTPTTCDVSRTKSDARAYFASSKDLIFTILGDMQTALRNGPSDAATSLAFDGLTRLSAVRSTASGQKAGSTSAQGAAVALDLLLCMNNLAASNPPSLTSLTNALGAGGLFAVRGTTTDAKGVFADFASYGITAGTPALPLWGTQPRSGETWATTARNGRFLLYGWTYDARVTQKTPISAALDTASYTAFELSVAPTDAFATVTTVATGAKYPIVGECGIEGGTLRVKHNGAEILGDQSSFDCTSTPRATASAARNTTLLASVGRAVGRLLLPTPAYAMFAVGGTAGLPDAFSPFSIADAGGASITFVTQPRDGIISQAINTGAPPVEIALTAKDGTPIVRVSVELQVANNSGSTVVATNYTATTDATGHATFPQLTVNKAGGYTLSVNVADGITGVTQVSTLFNIKNKPAP